MLDEMLLKQESKITITDNFHKSMYADGVWYVSGLTNGNIIRSWDNGLTWEDVSKPFPTAGILAYGNGILLSAPYLLDSNLHRTTDNGATWDGPYVPSTVNLMDIEYGGGLFVMTTNSETSGTPQILTSPDGITWTVRVSLAASANGFEEILWTGSKWVVVTDQGRAIYSSNDGITWTAGPSSTGSTWWDTAFNGTTYVVAAGNGNVYTSTTLAAFTARTVAAGKVLRSITYGNGLFVVTTTAGDIYTSPDGTTWTARVSGVTTNLRDVNFANGVFLAVGVGTTILRSTDGMNWTRSI